MPRRFPRRAASAFAAAAILVGADLGAQCIAEARLGSLFDADPDLKAADVHIAPFAREIVLRHLSARLSGASVAIGELHLPWRGLAEMLAPAALAEPAEPSSPMPGTIRAENVVLTTGTTTIRIKKIEMAGTRLTNADLAALLDPKASENLESRLGRLNATAIVVPEIAIDDATTGSERHALLRQTLIASVGDGKAAAVSVANASVALTDGRQAVNGSSGAIEASGVNLPQVAHVVWAPRKDESEVARPMFDKIVVNAPRLDNVAQNAGLGATSVTATDVGGRPLARRLPDLHEAGTDTAQGLSDVAQSFSLGTLVVEGFAAHSQPGGEETRIAAAHVELHGLGGGKVGGIEMREFRLDGPYAKLVVGTADVGLFQVAAAPLRDTRVAARPSQLDLRQISVEVTPRDKPEPASPMRLTIDRVALAQDGGPSAIPASGSATISNLAFDLAQDGTFTRALHDMGYRHVTLAAAFTSSYEAGTRELTLHHLSVTEPAMGTLDVALRLGNVSQDLLSTDPEAVQDAAAELVARHVDLRLENAGLLDKAIALKAKQDGLSVADERSYGVDFFTNMLPQLLGNGAGIKAIGGAVAKFIADPKTLHITVDSKEGLGIGAVGMLGDPGALLDSLDIHASANE